MARAFSQREKSVIIAGGVFLICFLAYSFVIVPKRADLNYLKARVREMTSNYKEIRDIEGEYNRLKKDTDPILHGIQQRRADFDLSAFVAEVEKNQNFTRTRGNPPLQTPYGDFAKQSCGFSYQSKTLPEIVEFLKRIESPENVITIEWLIVRPKTSDPHQMDFDVRLATVVPLKEGK